MTEIACFSVIYGIYKFFYIDISDSRGLIPFIIHYPILDKHMVRFLVTNAPTVIELVTILNSQIEFTAPFQGNCKMTHKAELYLYYKLNHTVIS